MDIYFDRIRPLFDKSGKTDADLEREIGIPERKINQWNANYTKSYRKYIQQIAAYFHVSADYLMGLTDDPSPGKQKEKPPAQDGELSELQKEAWYILQRMDDNTLRKFIQVAKTMMGE